MQAVFNTTSRGFGAFFEEWDIILTPITALPTPKLGTMEYLTTQRQPVGARLVRAISGASSPTRRWPTSAASPASRCRWRAQDNGLPLGIQAQARQANDGLLLQLAAQVERAIDGRWNGGRLPAVHVRR